MESVLSFCFTSDDPDFEVKAAGLNQSESVKAEGLNRKSSVVLDHPSRCLSDAR